MFDYWLLITVFQRRYLSMTENSMIAQVESLPGMIRDELDALDARVRRLMDHNEYLSVKRVVITGCGDSHMAGLATELAFETLSGIPTEPMTAMQAARYGLPYQPKAIWTTLPTQKLSPQPPGPGHLGFRHGSPYP
jgi:glucosamine 6-phosphate synthetase-like amidotransferase/phosphosugar isomerase protein